MGDHTGRPERDEVVMELLLDDREATLLREILDATYRDLRYEVADTDQSGYKDQLRARAAAVLALLDRVGGPLPDAT